jgi:thioredoxin 1
MALQVVTEQTFESEVLRSEVPVLVEFGAEWCGPCKVVEPELTALARDLAGRAKIVMVDVDRSPMLAQALRIQSVPTFYVFKGGQPVEAGQGAMKKAALEALLTPHLPRKAGAVSAKEAAALLARGQIAMVDTRPPEVFARAHIKGALNFPLDTVEAHLNDLNLLAVPAVLYCRTGKETEALSVKLVQAGTPVAFLEGGVLGWEGEGYRLERA